MMKLGSNSVGYWKAFLDGKITLKEWIMKCGKELNLDGIELLDVHFPTTEEKYLKEIKKLATDLYLDIYCVSCCSNFGVQEKEKIEEQINIVKKWIDIGYFLGSPVVRCFAGRNEDENLRKSLWPGMVNAIKKCVAYAESKGIVLALENHNHHGFIQTSKDVLNLFKEVDSTWFRMCLDTGNYKDLHTSIEATAHLAIVVHAKLYGVDENGVAINSDGTAAPKLDYDRIFNILKKVNFNGYLSIEYESKKDGDIEMPKGVEFLRRMIMNMEKNK